MIQYYVRDLVCHDEFCESRNEMKLTTYLVEGVQYGRLMSVVTYQFDEWGQSHLKKQ